LTIILVFESVLRDLYEQSSLQSMHFLFFLFCLSFSLIGFFVHCRTICRGVCTHGQHQSVLTRAWRILLSLFLFFFSLLRYIVLVCWRGISEKVCKERDSCFISALSSARVFFFFFFFFFQLLFFLIPLFCVVVRCRLLSKEPAASRRIFSSQQRKT
jgi:hypothetical protein